MSLSADELRHIEPSRAALNKLKALVSCEETARKRLYFICDLRLCPQAMDALYKYRKLPVFSKEIFMLGKNLNRNMSGGTLEVRVVRELVVRTAENEVESMMRYEAMLKSKGFKRYPAQCCEAARVRMVLIFLHQVAFVSSLFSQIARVKQASLDTIKEYLNHCHEQWVFEDAADEEDFFQPRFRNYIRSAWDMTSDMLRRVCIDLVEAKQIWEGAPSEPQGPYLKKRRLRREERVSAHEVDAAASKWCHLVVMKALLWCIDKVVAPSSYDSDQASAELDEVLGSALLCQKKLEEITGPRGQVEEGGINIVPDLKPHLVRILCSPTLQHAKQDRD